MPSNSLNASAVFQFQSQEPWPDLSDVIPVGLDGMAAQAFDHFGLEKSEFIITGLAILASILGRWQVADDGLGQTPPAFNLLLVSDPTAQRGWINYLVEPWAINERNLSIDANPNNRPPTSHSVCKKFTCQEVDPASLSSAVLRSPDNCVTVLSGALDPLTEWMMLSRARQEQLNSILRLSWNRIPMRFGSQASSIQGSVNLLGMTGSDSLSTFIAKSAVNKIPPPFLFVRQRGPGKRFPSIEENEYDYWAELLRHANLMRMRYQNSIIHRMEPDVKAEAEKFFVEFRAALETVPSTSVPFLEWIPEMLLRLFVLFNVCSERDPSKGGAQVGPGAAMRASVLTTRWLAQEQYSVLQGISNMGCPGRTSSTGIPFDTADTTDTTDIHGLEQRVLARMSGSGPMTPRELQRSFHDLSAKLRDQIIQSLKSTNKILVRSDGRLILAHEC